MHTTYEQVMDLLNEFIDRDEIDLKISSGMADGSIHFDFPVGEFISKLTGVAVDGNFITQLQDVASMRLEGDEIPGVINFATAERAEVIDFLLKSERMRKTLSGLVEIVESNNNQAKARLGKDMFANSEGKLEITDEHGNKVANIMLERKQRPTWEDKNDQFEFVEAIGQGDVVQPSIPWQTVEKILTRMLDELPRVPFEDEGGFDLSFVFDPSTVTSNQIKRAVAEQAEAGFFDLSLTEWAQPGVFFDEEHLKLRVFFTYSDGTYNYIVERLNDKNTRRIARLFETRNAKVTKLYD